MRKKVLRGISLGLALMLMPTMLTGCRFGFASDPDDPNEEVKEEPIDTSVDTFEYDSALSGTNITLLNRNFLNLGIIESRNYIRISYGSFLYAGTNGISPFS